MQAAEEEIYPAFMTQGQDNYYAQMERLGDTIAPYRIAFIEAGTDQVLAGAEAAPIAWDGSDEDLPAGYDDCLERAVAVAEGRAEPSTLCAVNLMVSKQARGMRLSVRLMETLCDRATELGSVIAAIRPPGKLEHPRTPIDEYMTWTRDDGGAFDPWVRSFVDAGARVGPASPESLTITGSVGEWSQWTGTEFPSSGEYEIPGGLATLRVDREGDRCVYVEPSVWLILECNDQ